MRKRIKITTDFNNLNGANDLATPEEVYNHLNTNNMENKPKQEPMCNDWESYGVQLEQEVKDLKFKIANLEANKDWLTSQNEKLTKLVCDIDDTVNKGYENPIIIIISLIYSHRNPSLVGTTHTVEIDGNNYEVQVIKKI